MTAPTACATNWTADVRACTLTDEHYDDCSTPTCRGCLPRTAQVGFVCGTCFDRIESAVRIAEQFYADLDGIDRAKTPEAPDRHVFGPGIPIPPVPLTLDEVRRYHASFTGTAERWVSWQKGASDAVRFASALTRAQRTHPIAETQHQIRRTRCPRCNKRTLVWHPPQYIGGRVHVTCRDQTCGFDADQTSFEALADIEGQTTRNPSTARGNVPAACNRCGDRFQHGDRVLRISSTQLEHVEHYAE